MSWENPRRRRRYAPRRRRSYTPRFFRRYRKKRTIPIAPLMGLATGFIAKPHPGAHDSPLGCFMKGDWQGGANLLVENFTGYYPPAGQFNFGIMRPAGLWALGIGIVVHKVCGWLGINRVFSRMPSPLNKISI